MVSQASDRELVDMLYSRLGNNDEGASSEESLGFHKCGEREYCQPPFPEQSEMWL